MENLGFNMDQEVTNYYGVNNNNLPENNNIIQQSNVKQRGWKFFFVRLFYMLAFAIGLTYAMSRFSGQGILDSLQNTTFIFTLPVLFIIGFALAMWKFWFSVPWFILATVIVNSLIFGGFGGDVIELTAVEIPIFLIITIVVFGVERGFSAIPQKWLRITLASLPFVIMLATILFTYFK